MGEREGTTVSRRKFLFVRMDCEDYHGSQGDKPQGWPERNEEIA